MLNIVLQLQLAWPDQVLSSVVGISLEKFPAGLDKMSDLLTLCAPNKCNVLNSEMCLITRVYTYLRQTKRVHTR